MPLGRNFDSYYDPPDEPEIPICEDCGQDMESVYPDGSDPHCVNLFCPSRFHGNPIAKEMAEKLVDTLDTVSRLEIKIKSLKRILDIVSPGWDSDFRFGSSNK